MTEIGSYSIAAMRYGPQCADRLSQLHRRAPGVGPDVVHRTDAQRVDRAIAIERGLHVEDAIRTVGVAAAHVFQPVFDQAHRRAEFHREVAGEHRVLQTPLAAIAAADVDVEMHPHRVAGKA
jgi:hypothetical protein